MKKIIMIIGIIIGLYALEGNPEEIQKEIFQNLIKEYIGFEKNFGQVQNFEGEPVKGILLIAKLPGLGIFITEKGVSYVLYVKEKYARIDLELLNANIKEENIKYEEPLSGYSNYYLPGSSYGILGVITYRKVRIKEIYPGIDWVWRYENGKMHHEFEVKPNGDIGKIKMEIKYADISLSDDGKKIILSTPIGKIEDGEIFAYELKTKNRVNISYKLEDKIICFDIQNYLRKDNLIIDPPLSLLWATYYGGEEDEYGSSITTDVSGNIFLTGYTGSFNLPTLDPGGGAYYQGTIAGNYDAFILKFETSIISVKEVFISKPVEENKIYTLRNSKSIVLIFDIKKPCEIGLNFYNSIGSLIKKRNYGYLEKGIYRTEIKIDEMKNKNIYFLKINIGKESKTIKILNIE